MEKKKLVINAAVCDARNAIEDVLCSYDSIVITASTVLISKESKELISRYNVSINAANINELSKDTEVIVHNGYYEISGSTKMPKPTFLIVNGSLDIKEDAKDTLATTFETIHVNGSVSYPSKLQGTLPLLKVNGTIDSYPSDAIRLKNEFILDKIFVLKAKGGKYYVKNKVIIADETLDLSSLIDKGTTFITKRAFIAENLLETAINLFGDETDITVIPAGYKYVQEDTLNNFIINKYGDKLFVDGDLFITLESEDALRKLTGLKVNGSVIVNKKLTDYLMTIDVDYEELKMFKGIIIKGKEIINISKSSLSGYKDGATISGCGMVKISHDITPEEIEEKLQFISCGCITCSPNQMGAIELVSEDVGYINDKGNADDLDTEDDEDLYNNNAQVIKSTFYSL